MKLHDVPPKSSIRIKSTDSGNHPPAHRDFTGGEVLYFHHIDGMYSLCYDLNNNPVHLVAWAEVEVL